MDGVNRNNTSLVDLVATARSSFWNEQQMRGIPDDRIRQLWTEQCLNAIAPILELNNSAEPLDVHPQPVPMQNRRSAPSMQDQLACSQAMERWRTDQPRLQTNCSMDENFYHVRKRTHSSSHGSLFAPSRASFRQAMNDPHRSFDSVASAGRMTRTASGNPGLPIVQEAAVVEYDPSEWVHSQQAQWQADNSYDFTSAMFLPTSQTPEFSSPLSSSFSASVPPTPQSICPEGPSFLTSPMSRQESLSTHFNMIHIDSQASHGSEYTSIKTPQLCIPSNPVLSKAAEFHLSPSSLEIQGYLASTPLSTPIIPCNGAVAGNFNVAISSKISPTRRRGPNHNIATSSKRPLQPKICGDNTHTPTVRSDGPETIQVKSEHRINEKCKIERTNVVRMSKPKLTCELCDPKQGFRGPHELQRHRSLKHSDTRQAWICIDNSSDGKMLESCKKCRHGKAYGAYYNAAAHLRRVHFHPRRDGRKPHSNMSRAGKGGGNDPPMSVLKSWMKKVEVKKGQKFVNPSSAKEVPLSARERRAVEGIEEDPGVDPTLYPWFLENDLDSLEDESLQLEPMEMFDLEQYS